MSTTTSPTYLITSASGNIGKELVPLLLSQPSKPTLILPTSSALRLSSSLPSDLDRSRVHIIEGSVQDPQFIEDTLRDHKVTGVFLCLTGDDELFTTFNFLDAVKHSGCVKHVVYLTACGDFSLAAMKNGLLKTTSAAHIAVKFTVEAKLQHGVLPRNEKGGFSWTMIAPTLFFSNELLGKTSISEEGRLNYPLGSKGVSRVDTADIALSVVKAFEDDGKRWGGKKIMIGSLEMYTAQDTAKLWSKALGKDVKPMLSDRKGLKDFEKAFSAVSGPAWGRDLSLMFEMFEEMPFGMNKEEYDEQVELLGKEPNSYEKFVEETAKSWMA
jgi:uncharacterized protein YbjT (DUF2867 family)